MANDVIGGASVTILAFAQFQEAGKHGGHRTALVPLRLGNGKRVTQGCVRERHLRRYGNVAPLIQKFLPAPFQLPFHRGGLGADVRGFRILPNQPDKMFVPARHHGVGLKTQPPHPVLGFKGHELKGRSLDVVGLVPGRLDGKRLQPAGAITPLVLPPDRLPPLRSTSMSLFGPPSPRRPYSRPFEG
jgi:hypothetical protein